MAERANVKDVIERESDQIASESSPTNVSATEGNEGEEAAALCCCEPPAKKAKTPSTSGKADSKEEEDCKDPYPYARMRGIRIFSEREISSQDAEMTREYWNFWNQTAEELCSDRAYNDWGKRDLKLYIDAAWVVHKTNIQESHEHQLQEAMKELQERYGHGELPMKLKTEDENVTELLAQLKDSTANLCELNLELTKARGKSLNIKQRPTSDSYPQEKKDHEVQEMSKVIGEKEKNLYDGMAEVKKDQDSLKKALSRLGNLIQKAKRNCPTLPIILDPPLPTIETTIMHQM